MPDEKIEVSGTRRFTVEELREKVRESRAYWASPEGQAEARRQAERRAARSAPVRTSFEAMIDLLR
jgi:hypothetical protein